MKGKKVVLLFVMCIGLVSCSKMSKKDMEKIIIENTIRKIFQPIENRRLQKMVFIPFRKSIYFLLIKSQEKQYHSVVK